MTRMASSELDARLEAERHAKASGLIYVSDAQPGIRRRRAGKGFKYLGPDGRLIKDSTVLDRIRRLAIPPAYTDVWICLQERGHLQATGRDARGRKQYRYHPNWRSIRDADKFSRMLDFGSRLPRLRRRLKRDLALSGLPRDKVLAIVVALLNETLIRVGNEEYARTNKSYGLTTLRDQHVKFLRDGRATFAFRGKGGRAHDIVLDDKRLGRLIRRCQSLPGQQLFQYIDDEGQRQPIDSSMVNDYIRDAMCDNGAEGFTAKDFRTWGGTLCALAYLVDRTCETATNEREFKRCVVETAQHVADALRNTPAVCRKSYINPVVFEAWRSGALSRTAPKPLPRNLEQLALKVLRSAARRPHKAASMKKLLKRSLRQARTGKAARTTAMQPAA
jgi:DNA topoisomerase-1